jgi:hypothetical protein
VWLLADRPLFLYLHLSLSISICSLYLLYRRRVSVITNTNTHTQDFPLAPQYTHTCAHNRSHTNQRTTHITSLSCCMKHSDTLLSTSATFFFCVVLVYISVAHHEGTFVWLDVGSSITRVPKRGVLGLCVSHQRGSCSSTSLSLELIIVNILTLFFTLMMGS